MAYSEHARRYLADCGLPKERTYVMGSPMVEVLHQNLMKIKNGRPQHEVCRFKRYRAIIECLLMSSYTPNRKRKTSPRLA